MGLHDHDAFDQIRLRQRKKRLFEERCWDISDYYCKRLHNKTFGKISNRQLSLALYNTLTLFGSENFRNELFFKHQTSSGRVARLTKTGEMCFSFGITA